MRNRLTILPAMALVLAAAGFGQEKPAEIKGIVRDHNGKPIPNIALVFEGEKPGQIKHVRVSSDGSLETGLARASHRLVGTAPPCFSLADIKAAGEETVEFVLAWNADTVAGGDKPGVMSQVSTQRYMEPLKFSVLNFKFEIPWWRTVRNETTTSIVKPGGIGVSGGEACKQWERQFGAPAVSSTAAKK